VRREQGYLERLHQIWLEKCPEFYNYYFKEYYVCPNCGASIFDNYDKQEVGDWLMITCEKCDTVIKKYFSPKFVG
jgi:translation initiation factor 2 beta subunit (eIF-2beta)/eIF-5